MGSLISAHEDIDVRSFINLISFFGFATREIEISTKIKRNYKLNSYYFK